MEECKEDNMGNDKGGGNLEDLLKEKDSYQEDIHIELEYENVLDKLETELEINSDDIDAM